MAVITLTDGSAPGRPSSRRTNVMTDTLGAVTSFVASPAARRRAAKGGVVEINIKEIQRIDAQRGGQPGYKAGSRTLESRLPDPDARRAGQLQFRRQFFSGQPHGLTGGLQAVASKRWPRVTRLGGHPPV